MNLTSIIPLLDSFPGQRRLLPQRLVSCPGGCGNRCFKALLWQRAGWSVPLTAPSARPSCTRTRGGRVTAAGLLCAVRKLFFTHRPFIRMLLFFFGLFFSFYIYTPFMCLCVLCVPVRSTSSPLLVLLPSAGWHAQFAAPCASSFQLLPMFSIKNCATVKLCRFLFFIFNP